MTEILQKIDEIISRRHDFRVQAVGGAYFLQEPKVVDYPQTLIKQRGKMLMLKLDVENSNQLIFPLFNDAMEGLTQICDYIIFYPKDNKLFVFICEQKTSKPSAKHQVEAGRILAEFIVKMVERMLNFKHFEVEYRALIFSLSQSSQFASSLQQEPYVLLKPSQLKNKLLRTGEICYLDNLCF